MKTKTFRVEYSDDGDLLNLNPDPAERLKQVLDLREQGFEYISDQYYTMLTGLELCDIDDYITETKSYI